MTSEEKAKKVIELARSLVGTPYKYGAKMSEAPEVFDCSGFVKYVFDEVGVDLPRSTIEQAAEGKEVKLDEVVAGDLIFTHGTRGHYNPRFPQGIGHVGIVTLDSSVIHAASQRLSEKPIIEEGKVVENESHEFIAAWGPIIIIRRMI